MLDPASPLPLYHQLARWLEGRVSEGQLRAGDRIESEPELARRFRIGRPTVRQATELLVRQGLLERRRGAGTFVRAPSPPVDLFGLGGTLASFEQSGVEARSLWLEGPTRCDGELRLSRLHMVEDDPVVLEELQLDAEVFGALEGRDLRGESLSRLAREELGLRLDHARQTFRVARAGASRAAVLACSAATALLHVQRQLVFGGTREAVRVELFCRTDRLQFSQTLKGEWA